MKSFSARVAAVCTVLTAALGGLGCQSMAAAEPVPGAVAVVELFTSEGCSSCPPADAAMAELVRDARASGRAVYPIAWHVDYWNDLGWTDPFSSATATSRQRAYAAALKLDEIYTPQMVVNGRAQFLGSNAAKRTRAIAEALSRPATAQVTLSLDSSATDNKLVANYQITNAPADGVLEVVLVERGLHSDVVRGENSGELLRHENVARASESVTLGGRPNGQITLAAPPGIRLSNASVIGFVHPAGSLAIAGAAAVDVVQSRK